jgi:hypothetical protein
MSVIKASRRPAAADYLETLFAALYYGILLFAVIPLYPSRFTPYPWYNFLGLALLIAVAVAPVIEVDRAKPSLFSWPCFFMARVGQILGGG